MNIEETFAFLIKNYGFTYKCQEFINCYGGHWTVITYSFYNESGCFTIHTLPQRGELDFYYAPQFSTKREELYEKMVDIRSIEPKIWDKHMKVGIFNRPFFWCRENKVLSALAEVLSVHIAEQGEFFGIRVRSLK